MKKSTVSSTRARRRLTAAGGITALTILFLSADSAVASHGKTNTDGKIYPGATCHPSPNDLQASKVKYVRGQILTQQDVTNTVRVYCPIVRDGLDDTDGVDFVTVWVGDGSINDGVSCALLSLDEYNNTVDLGTGDTGASWTGDIYRQLHIDSTDDMGGYILYCDLPPLSGVYQYRVYEYTPTHGAGG